MQHNQPVLANERLVNLDIIRGVALLGILIMNIQSFSMVFSAYGNPTSFGDLTGLNFTVYYYSHLFADQKFMTIFSMLFGVGIVLMADNIEKKQGNAVSIHYRRMTILALVGMAHAYLLWYGDILFAYAIGGMIAFLARKWSVKQLLTCGFILITLCSVLVLLASWSMSYWEQSELAQLKAFWAPSQPAIADNIQANQSSWLGQMETRHFMAVEAQSEIAFYLLRIVGLMLVGMAFFKLDFFGKRFTTTTLLTSATITFCLGLALVVFGVDYNFSVNWNLESMFNGSQYNYWGSLMMAYSYVALLLVFCRTNRLAFVKQLLASVGKLALSNYLLQSIICGFVFYGWGLGYFGTFERTEQLFVVIAIWAFQLLFSAFWLKHCYFGPFEWLWRSATYGQWQSLIRS